MLKKNLPKLALLGTFLLAFILRFNSLSSNPPSLDWDEASIGYNAYSILKSGRDEYGSFLPLEIRSFGDYKPALYVYFAIPFVAIFGLSELAVRLPSAIFGTLAVIATYFLVKEIFDRFLFKATIFGKKITFPESFGEYVSLMSAFFLTVSPWHLQFSKAAFEGNIGLFFLISGVLFFLKGLFKSGINLVTAILFFILSLYSYHSFRIIIPVLTFFLTVIFIREIQFKKKYFFPSLILLTIFFLPIIASFFSLSGSSSRLSMVTIFSGHDTLKKSIQNIEYDLSQNDSLGAMFHNRRVVYFLLIVKNYLNHWDPDFLFIHGDGGKQHHAVDLGMVYLFELPFILFGMFLLFNNLKRKILLFFLWFLIAPVPASLTTGTPHPVRAIAMLPVIHIFSSVGVVSFIMLFIRLKNKIYKYGIFIFLIFSFVFNFSYYLHQYYIHTPIEYGNYWQYGYKELFNYLKTVEDKYDKIVVTYKYDQPYIYYLFYNKTDPFWYQFNWDYLGTGEVERMRRIIGKYEFRNIDWNKDSILNNVLLVGTSEEFPEGIPKNKEIKFLDGSIAFYVVKT